MARRARWAVAGLAHYVLLSGHNGQRVFTDEFDRQLFHLALKAACEVERVDMLAHALQDTAAHLLLRPASPKGLSRAMQAVGRRFVRAYNLRHARTGTPWNGRFKATPVQAGEWTLQCLLMIDGLRQATSTFAGALRWQPTPVGVVQSRLVDPPELWALGNTPFEREERYSARLQAGLTDEQQQEVLAAVSKGLPLGGPVFLAEMGHTHQRAAVSRPRGRPRLTADGQQTSDPASD
jgi:putative transposase